MNALWDRIETILAHRGWTQSELCKHADVGQASLSRFKGRAAVEPNAGMSTELLAKIARASGADLAWLTSGDGEHGMPGARTTSTELEDGYTTRAPVIAALVADKADPALIAAMKAERQATGDPGLIHGEAYWWDRVDFYETKIARMRKRLKQTPNDETMTYVPGQDLNNARRRRPKK